MNTVHQPDREQVSRHPAARPGSARTGCVIIERRDAARNRRRVLDAAAELIDLHGVDALTMDAVAKHAGVGKGTLYRRFGNRTGLMNALLDAYEHDLQVAYLSGPAPLGPGASPLQRLLAFGRARLACTQVEADIRLAADGSHRFGSSYYLAARDHVTGLLNTAGVGDDPYLSADAVLAPLDAALVAHQLHDQGYSLEQIARNWETLVGRIFAATECASPNAVPRALRSDEYAQSRGVVSGFSLPPSVGSRA
ncbi:helix-turn-helix domain-containing protein [Nocardia sp. NPDC050378]|uniref:TetR/AcrR family transcriptional regulator n=1 Tax=Nocardia sp. NPDC050378 TaxID=3155400 RepID=UPI0033FE24FB